MFDFLFRPFRAFLELTSSLKYGLKCRCSTKHAGGMNCETVQTAVCERIVKKTSKILMI